MPAAGGAGTAVVLADDHYENLELHYPRLRLREAGYQVQVVGAERGRAYRSKEGYPATADATFADVDAGRVRILIIPGGYAPDRLRRHRACLDLVRAVWESGGVVAFICHAGWVPISAGIVRGRRVTSVPAIKDDLVNAGADWVDQRWLRDGAMVTAQGPEDLPAFMAAALEAASSVDRSPKP